MCVALPNGLVLQEINKAQLNVMHKSRKELLEMIERSKYQ